MVHSRAFWLAEAEFYLRECRAEKRSVRASEFALHVKCTPARLAQDFHLAVGLGIKTYLTTRQIEEAKELLRTTSHSTAEIAVLTGFGTARTFYRAFRGASGISPTEYRKEMSLAGADFRTYVHPNV